MRHYVASATQTVKSEEKVAGGGGGRGGGILCEMDRGGRSGRRSVYICVRKATIYWYANNSQNPSIAVVKMLSFSFKFIDKFSTFTCKTSWRIMADFSLKKKLRYIENLWHFIENVFLIRKRENHIRTWAFRTLVFLPWSDTTTPTPQNEKIELSIIYAN